MKTNCDIVTSAAFRAEGETARKRLQCRSCLGLAVLILLAVGPRGLAGTVILPPPVAQFHIDTIDPYGTETFSFKKDVKSGPLAFDFAKANDPTLTTAQYIFQGFAKRKKGDDPYVFAQWSPQFNATGGFVGFLGNNQKGTPAKHPTVQPTTVAYITDVFGKQYGYITADFNSSKKNDTTFMFHNTSGYKIDPTLTGEQIGVSIPENFTGQPSKPVTSGGTISSGTPTSSNTTGNFTIPNITASATPAKGQTATLTITSSQSFTAPVANVPINLSMSSGSVTISDSSQPQGPKGGSGFISATAVITDKSKNNQQIDTLQFQSFGFNQTQFIPPSYSVTIPFGSRSAEGALTGLSSSDTYSVALTWKLQFTSNDGVAKVVADPKLKFSFSSPSLLPSPVPEPSTLVLATLTAIGLGGSHWLSRRRRLAAQAA